MTHGIAADRLVCSNVLAEPIEPDGVSAPLATSSTTLTPAAASEIGLWEAGPGTDTDIEIDEVFLVLAGAGTVTFEEGSSLALRPGVVVRLVAGDRTTWTITDRLRKLYLA
jgi:uncharacterized cupin superfamily protein